MPCHMEKKRYVIVQWRKCKEAFFQIRIFLQIGCPWHRTHFPTSFAVKGQKGGRRPCRKTHTSWPIRKRIPHKTPSIFRWRLSYAKSPIKWRRLLNAIRTSLGRLLDEISKKWRLFNPFRPLIRRISREIPTSSDRRLFDSIPKRWRLPYAISTDPRWLPNEAPTLRSGWWFPKS